MPRLKEREIPFGRMQRLLKSYGLNGVKLGRVLGVSPNTAKIRIDCPAKLTLGDLDAINRKVGISYEEIRAAMTR